MRARACGVEDGLGVGGSWRCMAVEMCSGDVGDVVREEAARPSPCEWRASVDECGLKYTCEMVSIIRESGRRRFVFSTVSFEAHLNNLHKEVGRYS